MAGHFELDAETYADWGIDYLKVSLKCYSSQNESLPNLGQQGLLDP